MKNLYALVFVLFGYVALAQSPIINQNALPEPGDTFAFGVDKYPTVGFDYEQIAATWDLAALQNDTSQFASYGVSAQLPFAASFPVSNLYTYGPGFLYGGLGGSSPYGGNYGHMMFASAASGFSVVGFRSDFGFGMETVTIQPNEILMPVPFTYGDSIYQQSSWQMAYNNVPMDVDTFYKRTTYKSLVAKGYGSLNTPFSTYGNCLAVEEKIIYHDSLFIKFGTVVLVDSLIQSDTLLNVNLWTNQCHNSVLIANYNPHTFVCEKMSWLNYQDLAAINESQKPLISIYPNPVSSNEICSISGIQAEKVRVFSLDGRLQFQTAVSQNLLALPQMLPGQYIMQIESYDNFVGNVSLIIN